FAEGRIRSNQVQVIRNHHQVSHRQLRRDPARGIGDEQVARAKRAKYAHRKRSQLRRVALVNVESTAQRDDIASPQAAKDERALVAGNGRFRKARYVAEW